MRCATKLLLATCIATLCLTGQPCVHAQGSLAQYSAKRRRMNAMDPKAWFELGTWCKKRLMWTHANGAFQQAMALGPTMTAQCCYELATIAQYTDRIPQATEWLEKAKAADPNFEKANLLHAKLVGAKRAARQGKFDDVVKAYQEKRYADMIKAVEALAGKPDAKDNKMADMASELSEALGGDVFEALVMARLLGKCKPCGGGGFVPCRSCLSKGCRIVRKTEYEKKGADTASSVILRRGTKKRYLKVCKTCAGLGSVACKACGGSGLDIKKCYEGEKTLLAKMLAAAADEFYKKIRKSKKGDPVEGYRLALKTKLLYEQAIATDKQAATEQNKRVDRDAKRARSKLRSARAKLMKEVTDRLKDIAKERNATLVKDKDEDKGKDRKKD